MNNKEAQKKYLKIILHQMDRHPCDGYIDDKINMDDDINYFWEQLYVYLEMRNRWLLTIPTICPKCSKEFERCRCGCSYSCDCGKFTKIQMRNKG